jgi:hypothetical protein
MDLLVSDASRVDCISPGVGGQILLYTSYLRNGNERIDVHGLNVSIFGAIGENYTGPAIWVAVVNNTIIYGWPKGAK